MPVRRELARARRRERGRCVRHRHRARPIEATSAWPVEHAVGWTDDGNARHVGQDEHVGRPTARRRTKRCRIQAVGGNALASLASPRNGAVGHAPPAPCARWGVSRLTIGTRCNSTMSSTPSASTRMEALFDNRWSGKNCSTATPWSVVGRRGMVQWAEDHATPTARRIRCFVAPPAHYTSLSLSSGARAVPHSPRAGGAARWQATFRWCWTKGPSRTVHSLDRLGTISVVGAHGRRPRATGHSSSTANDRARRRRTSSHGPGGRDGADMRRRDAGANPAGPGSIPTL